MVSQDILIINRLGLHARAAAQLVRMANEYPCDIRLTMMNETLTQNQLWRY